MNLTIAKRFAAAVRKVFPDAVADSAEDEHGNVWVHKEALYVPDLDARVRALPDFYEEDK